MKVMFIRLRVVAVAAICVLGVFLWAYTTRPNFSPTGSEQNVLPIFSVQRQYKTAALTFDTASDDGNTQQLIDVLARHEVRATFFVTGDWARGHSKEVRALHDAGHEVMNLSDTYESMTRMTTDRIFENINACNDTVEAITGRRPTLFRAPGGAYDDGLIEAVRALDMETIQWNVDSLDLRDISAPEIQRQVLANVDPGSIIQFHSNAGATVEALPGLIEALKQDGYQLAPVTEILLTGEAAIDQTGRQQPVLVH